MEERLEVFRYVLQRFWLSLIIIKLAAKGYICVMVFRGLQRQQGEGTMLGHVAINTLGCLQFLRPFHCGGVNAVIRCPGRSF